MDQQVKQWLDYAAQDLGVARHLFENYHPKPLEIVCYHCQQSAEKAIKAVIVSLHWPTGIPKSHDLSFLLNQIHNYISIPDAIGDAADALTPFGTKKASCKSLQKIIIFQIRVSMWTTVFQAVTSKDLHFSR